jgi:uncharacterized membrane protein YkoI
MVKWLGSVVAGLLLVAVTNVWADEEKIDPSKLPEKVVAAVKEKFPDGKIVRASKEKEGGETIYEVALKDKDQNVSMDVKEDGTIVEIEKEIKVKDLPEAVTKGLEEKYPKAKFKKAEEVIKKDKLEYYEVIVVTEDKKQFEVQVNAEGKVLKEGTKKDVKEKEEKEDK